jgi:hypothetical protein
MLPSKLFVALPEREVVMVTATQQPRQRVVVVLKERFDDELVVQRLMAMIAYRLLQLVALLWLLPLQHIAVAKMALAVETK